MIRHHTLTAHAPAPSVTYTVPYSPPSDEARRVVGWVLYHHMRRGGLGVDEFRKRYL